MSKKIMLLALAVASVAMFALPAAASAQEIHWTNTEEFAGTGGPGSLTAEGEPTITCESVHITGKPSAGGTTGSIHFDFTGCHTTVFGFTAKCRTTGSALDNTITVKGTYHLITTSSSIPDMLITVEEVNLSCAGISNTAVKGNIIGTITKPACGGESTELTTKFSATGSTQNDLEYTGVKYDLLATTSGGAAKTAGENAEGTVKQAAKGKLECT